MRRLCLGLLLVATLASCDGGGSTPAAPAATASARTSNSVAEPTPTPTQSPPSLARKSTPAASRIQNETDCADGKPEGCRRLADRYRGYGWTAGCGLDRGRVGPSLKRDRRDGEADRRLYLGVIEKACELGDDEACVLSKVGPDSYLSAPRHVERLSLRSSATDNTLMRFQGESVAGILTKELRDSCLDPKERWSCWGSGDRLYTAPDSKDESVSDELRERALAICRDTLDCSPLLMMLDKSKYAVAEVLPIRHAMGEVLAAACIEGACTCGEAARNLPSSDERRRALAEAGCADGEAEGCYELARLLEAGEGVQKDEPRAVALYQLACPAEKRADGSHAYDSEYSPRACDRLAQYFAAGELPPKHVKQAEFYAERACDDSGFEIEHAPCLRMARFRQSGRNTGRNLETSLYYALGRAGTPVLRRECERPSVADECKKVEHFTNLRAH